MRPRCGAPSMRAALVVLAVLVAAPTAVVAGGLASQAFGVGLGKTYRIVGPADCYAPAAQEVVVDYGARTVRGKTLNPCGLLPLGAVEFEHTFTFEQCTFYAASLACEDEVAGERHVVHLGPDGQLPHPAASMLYLVQRDQQHWTETLARGVTLD